MSLKTTSRALRPFFCTFKAVNVSSGGDSASDLRFFVKDIEYCEVAKVSMLS